MTVLSSCTVILLLPTLVFSWHPHLPTYYKFHPNPVRCSEVPKFYSHSREWFVQREEKKKVPISLKKVRSVNFIQVGGKNHSV